MPVTVIDKIKQKNGSFKLMDAADVEMESGKSVEEALRELYKMQEAAVSVDLSKYETEGIVIETYADGSILTHNFEFDEDGRPTKRTDSDGNVQTITW